MDHHCSDPSGHMTCDPDFCITAKLRYWRTGGMSTPRLGGLNATRKDFHDLPSVVQRERDHVRLLRARGVDFERA